MKTNNLILSKSGSKKLIESCQTTKKNHGEKGNIWQAVITCLKQIQWKRLQTDCTQSKSGVNLCYLREKVEHQPRHGHVGGPRAGVARGAPAGAPLPSEENCVNHLLKPKLFCTLPYHLSWPPLAATLGQLVNPVWDWWRWRPCQESRLLERVRCCLDVQLSYSSPPNAPLLSAVLSCCTLPTPRSLVIHTMWPQIENRPS